MNTVETVIAILIISILVVVGILLCTGKCSFLLGAVRDMKDGHGKTTLTRVCGVIVILIAVILTVVIICKY